MPDNQIKNSWYKEWFDSPYYHILYANRDDQEAMLFINNLLVYLKPSPASKMLDLACGNGRHSKWLADKGYEVTGVDLSRNNILQARQFQMTNLHFFQHDMRLPIGGMYFDYVFNFFTSFGYFKSDEEHQQTLESVYSYTDENGFFLLDFLNVHHVNNSLIATELKIINDITFDITRTITTEYITKTINIRDGHHEENYEEKVRNFDENKLIAMVTGAGFEVINVFGNYLLQSFVEEISPRCILLCKKNAL